MCLDAANPFSGSRERVAPAVHRRRPRMTRGAGEDRIRVRAADDAIDDAERMVESVEDRTLFDVTLEVPKGTRTRSRVANARRIETEVANGLPD